MKKWIALLLVAVMLLSFAACGSQERDHEDEEEEKEIQEEVVPEEPTEETTEEPTTIPEYLDNDLGSLKYVSLEKGNPGLTDYENKDFVVLTFAFSNKQAKPQKVSEMYTIQFFQNNVEIDHVDSFWSTGGDQYEHCRNYFKEVMNGASIEFGRGVEIVDHSPVTIFIEDKQTGEYASLVIELPQ